MSTMGNWIIAKDDFNLFQRESEFSNYPFPGDMDLSKANDIANKIQYFSLHPLNCNLSINQKIAYFNSYVKSRMDFLADIATATPTMESSKLFFMELIAGFDKNRILLDRISGIERLRFRLMLHDCRRCVYIKKQDCAPDECRKIIDENNDFAIAIPNDIIGQHAFYIILENIIRNTAKHSVASKSDEMVSFHIEVREPNEDNCTKHPGLRRYYEIQVYDSAHHEIRPDFVFKIEDKKFFIENELTKIGSKDISDIEYIDPLELLIYRQNIFINQPLLDKDNKLRQGAWGMIEMEAAAAYLRKIPVEYIDNMEYSLEMQDLSGSAYNIISNNHQTLDILKAFIKTTIDGKRHFGYRFFLLKPKEILVIVDDKIKEIKDENKNLISPSKLSSALLNYGICLKYSGQRLPEGMEQFIVGEIYEHELMLNLTESSINENAGVLPNRIVCNVNDMIDDLVKLISKEKAQEFKEKVWKNYFEKLPNIYIYPYKKCNYSFPEANNSIDCIDAEFDHHAQDWHSQLYKNFTTEIGDNRRNYLEVTTGLNNLTEILRKSCEKINFEVNEKRELITYYKLLDSINCQIIVLDERIQEAAYSLHYKPEATTSCPNPDPIPYNELYTASGIYVPHPINDFNFSRISYAGENSKQSPKLQLISLLKKISISLPNKGELTLSRVKFLIIHLGVLEKLLNAKKGGRVSDPKKEIEKIRELVNEFVSALAIEMGAKIKPIIISGRGTPPNLPRDIPFVNYSAVSQYLIDNRNKYLLTELLFSTRVISNQ